MQGISEMTLKYPYLRFLVRRGNSPAGYEANITVEHTDCYCYDDPQGLRCWIYREYEGQVFELVREEKPMIDNLTPADLRVVEIEAAIETALLYLARAEAALACWLVQDTHRYMRGAAAVLEAENDH